MANSDILGGAASGAAAGSSFGAIGIFAGAIIGGFSGARSSRKKRLALDRQLKADTKQAYGISKGNYLSIKNNRAAAENVYAANVASDFARRAASGRRLDDSARDRIIGANARERDSALTQVDIQEGQFQNSQAFSLLKKDYDYLGGVNQKSDRSLGGDEDVPTTYSVRTEGITGEGYFTDEQKNTLRTYESSGNDSEVSNYKNFVDYANSIRPSFEEYQGYKFGDEEDKAAFSEALTGRINTANEIYDATIIQRDAEQIRRSQLVGES